MAYPPLPVDKQYAGHPQIPARGVPLLLGVTDIPETFLPLTDHLGGDHDALHEPAALDFGATDLALVFGGNRSRGYDDGEADGLQQQQAQGLKVQEPFCLAPGVDTAGLKMTWRVHGKTNFASAKLELFASGVAEPIWKKRWGGAWGAEDAAIDTFQADRVGDTASFQGELPWTDVQLDPGAYPDGLLTVKGSPYQLRLTLSAKKAEADPEDLDLVAYPMTAWTFFHVAVHSFTYKFGPPDWLSKDRPDITDEHREKVVGTRAAGNGGAIDYGLEGAVLEELRQAAHPGQDQTQAKLKATSFHQVNLTANFNSKRGRSSDSAAWGERWGHGPRLPLLAYAWIRKNDGGHTDAHVDKVLAGARLLWDWQESSPDRWKQATQTETHGGGDVTRQWLGNLLQQHNGAAVPQGSSNCPAVFGGKVGGAQPVFLPQPTAGNGKGSLPFKVTPCQTRTHAAVSEFDATGKTGVLFQPSRMAGDHYVVRSYLYTGDHLDSLADLEAADVAKGSPGTFEVHKRVHVHHLVLTDLPGVAVNDLVETVRVRASAQAYLDLQVTTVAPTGTAYDTLRKEALKRLGAKSLNNAFLNFELVHLLAPGHPGSSLIKTVASTPSRWPRATPSAGASSGG